MSSHSTRYDAIPLRYNVNCDDEECEGCWIWILASYSFIGGIFLIGYCIAAKVCAPKQLGWSTDIDDCFSDIGTCCMACWCPCINFGNIAAYAWDSSSSWICCLAYLGAACLGFQQCFSMMARDAFRRKLAITGDCCSDCCIHAFAHGCALCQEQRELDKVNSGQRIAVHPPTMVSTNGSMNPVMPMQPVLAHAHPQPQQTMTVQAPPGARAGMIMQVTTPTGQVMQVMVPQGLQAGQSFVVGLPAVAPAQPMVQATVVSSDPWGDQSQSVTAGVAHATMTAVVPGSGGKSQMP